ncbi:MAG TPA: hypothetical protein VFZ09_28535 [Archangium sp.]|uniref:hypothetical protein n=1 Tax=Archangium sp. TaxID=1872627 RepID=UPI002E343061|nr:hypothetical protein [Archangium sp.]HEX5750212.1 hypothetical protein [Archangium sp.]
MALVGAACALLLAVVAGVCALDARGAGHTEARRVSTVREPKKHGRSLSAHLPGRHQNLLGVHVSPVQGQLELPRPTSKPPPLHPRADARPGPAIRPEALLAERTRRQLSCVLPTRHGRIADRPIVANCPARGPPRTA